MKLIHTGIASALALTLMACSPSPEPVTTTETTPPTTDTTPAPGTTTRDASKPDSAKPDANTPDNPKLANWMGRWQGQEGTYLKIEPADEFYSIELADLDGPTTYKGTAAGDHIEFTRNGKTETIRATDGPGTGMKYLGDKKDCLVITVGGEGYCRD